MSEHRLGKRAHAVFETFLDGRGEFLHPADQEEAKAFWNWLGDFEHPGRVERAPRRWPGQAAAAAAALLLMLAGGITWISDTPAVKTQAFTSGHAERRLIRLTDGSTVALAADSRVDVTYTPTERHLRLVAGEALFDVAHNKQWPFVVQTDHGTIQAVGTSFDVTVSAREAQVTVVEGVVRVALSDAGRPVREPIEKLAHKGEQVTFSVHRSDDGSTAFIREAGKVDVEGVTAWTRGQLVFHGEPLSKVVEEINRYARDRVVLTDPKAADMPVYGLVDQGDTAAVRDLVADPHAVAVERDH